MTSEALILVRMKKRKILDDVLHHVHRHIKGLPTCTSHYSRAKSKDRVYLPPGSSQRTLYKDFVKFLEDEGVPKDKVAPAWKYSEIFSTYNIGVEPPKTDSCNFCDEMTVAIMKAKKENDVNTARKCEIDKKVHLKKAQVAHDIKKVYNALEHQEDVGPDDPDDPDDDVLNY